MYKKKLNVNGVSIKFDKIEIEEDAKDIGFIIVEENLIGHIQLGGYKLKHYGTSTMGNDKVIKFTLEKIEEEI